MATSAKHASASTGAVSGGDMLSARELRAWRGMLRTHAVLTKALDAELDAAHGLPLSSYEVLMHLNDAEDQRMRMSDLADLVILSRSGLTRLVDRLEREGLLERQSCASDARGSFASLTAAGRRKLAAARATHLARRAGDVPRSLHPGGAGAPRRRLGAAAAGRRRRPRGCLRLTASRGGPPPAPDTRRDERFGKSVAGTRCRPPTCIRKLDNLTLRFHNGGRTASASPRRYADGACSLGARS